jgi:hypothetical protein
MNPSIPNPTADSGAEIGQRTVKATTTAALALDGRPQPWQPFPTGEDPENRSCERDGFGRPSVGLLGLCNAVQPKSGNAATTDHERPRREKADPDSPRSAAKCFVFNQLEGLALARA